jgi:arylsulfatase A-like enzyme
MVAHGCNTMIGRRTFLEAAAGATLGARNSRAAANARPNILLILADDVGYSDIGCYGGEIQTPNIDRLAAGGLRFTQFYNAARCCPSRASLLTGLYAHQTGLGNMTGANAPDDLEGYTGHLSEHCATIPEILRPTGYSAYMTGKWHLGQPGPVARGFEEYYGLFHGFDSCWDASKYTRLPKDRPTRAYGPGHFYSTNAITDYTLDFLAAARQRKQPFFAYLAYNAAHFPLHAPKETIDKYVAMYEKGWDHIREERFMRLRKMGLLGDTWEFTPRGIVPPNRVATPHGWANKQNPAWDSIDPDRRADLTRRMAVYAAMIEVMDRNIGRVVEDLRSNGELDNALIMFLSDNGACAEWDPWGFDGNSGPDNILHKGAELEKMGQPGTYHSYGSGWANACNTPWRLYKHYDHEGGISTPFIAHWPAGIKRKGALEREPGHIIDLMPTCAELAGAKYPSTVPPMEGRSLLTAFAGKPIQRDALYWEHEGNRAIRIGKWKAVALLAGGEWELYDMDKDRTEMHNLATSEPRRVVAMAQQWEQWARRTHALPWPWQPAYNAKTEP